MKLYKIMRLSDGLFSAGQTHYNTETRAREMEFTKSGKLFKLPALNSHLRYLAKNDSWPYDNCMVVEYALAFTEAGGEILRKFRPSS